MAKTVVSKTANGGSNPSASALLSNGKQLFQLLPVLLIYKINVSSLCHCLFLSMSCPKEKPELYGWSSISPTKHPKNTPF